MSNTKAKPDQLKTVFDDRSETERKADSLTGELLSARVVIMRMVRDYLMPMKGYVALSLISMAVVAAATGALPFLMQQTSDRIVVAKDINFLWLMPPLIILVVCTKAISEYISSVSASYIGQRIDRTLKQQMVRSLMQADLDWFQRTHTGRFTSSFTHDIPTLQSAAGLTLVAVGKNLLKVIFLAAAMIYMDPLLSAAAALGLPFAFLSMGRQRKKMIRRSARSFQEKGDIVSMVSQALAGIRVVKAYGQEDAELQRINASLERDLDFTMQTVRTTSASGPVTEALAGIGIAAAIAYGGYRGITGSMTPGEFMGFITAAMLMYQPLKMLATLQTTLQSGVVAASRIFPIFDALPVAADQPDAKALKVEHGEIRFENVTFGYEGGGPVLRDFSMHVEPGQSVALVGPSGAGKSTVLNLLLRFYEPEAGSISIDGQSITDAQIQSVRKASALVTQDPFLFDDTVRANIAYGTPGLSNDQITEAAQAAIAHDFIMAMQDGYDARVGEAGNRLSGGQKQRISFARALVRNAPIILLDEPTSALDSQSEAQLQQALESIVENRTVIMIAHRLSTVKKADVIHVMEEGQIIESGTHDALLKQGGAYRKLYDTQFGAESEAGSDADLTRQSDQPGTAKQPDIKAAE